MDRSTQRWHRQFDGLPAWGCESFHHGMNDLRVNWEKQEEGSFGEIVLRLAFNISGHPPVTGRFLPQRCNRREEFRKSGQFAN